MSDDLRSARSEEPSVGEGGTVDVPSSLSAEDDSERRQIRKRVAELRRQFAEDLARVHELGLPRSR
jgi:hypothetical protein